MSKDDSSKIDRFLPDASTVALAQDQAASDAAAERLRADEELRAIVKAQRDADDAALRAGPPPAPPSTGQVHIDDAKPNPAPGRVTRPRAYLNLASPDLKRGLPTVKVDRQDALPAAGLDTIPRVERRWPWALLVGLAVVGAFWLALSLGGPSPADDAAATSLTAPTAPTLTSAPAHVDPVPPVTTDPPPTPSVEPPPPIEPATAAATTTEAPAPPKTAGPAPSQQPASTAAPPAPPASAQTTPPPQPSSSGKGMTFDFKKGPAQ